MFYRRKVLLALLQVLDGKCRKTEFQKKLFLLNERLESRQYSFVPYRYGCFSYVSYADKRALTSYNILNIADDWELVNKDHDFVSSLKHNDRRSLECFLDEFSRLHGNELIRYVYDHYPYYAINSEILHELLSESQIASVFACRNNDNKKALFTIGYEGRDLDEYINELIKNNIKLLCDVRRNPASMKYGFSRRQLSSAVESLGIRYIHVPQLGIPSSKRKGNNVNFQLLFEEYERELIRNMTGYIETILSQIESYRRIALTCFERDYRDCHRGRIAKVLKKDASGDFSIYHI